MSLITISGNYVFVASDEYKNVNNQDALLECKTSLGPVNITLPPISDFDGFDNIQIVVNDIDGNAAANNITITPNPADEMNGVAGSVIISDNGQAASIRIAGPNSWLYAEGVDTSPFAPITSVAYATLLALFNAGTMIAGFYKITDKADGGIIVKANSGSSLDDYGTGIFLNGDYNGVGDYSGVAGFAGQLGVWRSTLAPVVGNVVIYNNLNYVNLTGAVGTAPSGDAVNWSLLLKSVTNGYVQVSDNIGYDIIGDSITSRSDIYGNVVESSAAIAVFQFGNSNVADNKVVDGSTLNCINQSGQIIANEVTSQSSINATNNDGVVAQNVATSNSSINAANNDGNISGNGVSESSTLSVDGNTGAVLGNNINSTSVFAATNNMLGSIQNNDVNSNSNYSSTDNSGLEETNTIANGSSLGNITNSGTISGNQLVCFSQGTITANAGLKQYVQYTNAVFAI